MPSEGISLGSVTVTVVPVAKGIDKTLRDQLEPAAAAAGDDAGKVLGERIAQDVEDAVPEGFRKGREKAKAEAETTGDEVGKSVRDKVEQQVEDAVPSGVQKGRTKAKAPAQTTGDEVGKTIGDRVKQPIEDSIPDGVDKGREKAKDSAKKTGADVGNAVGGGMSPLIVGALVGAGTIGGPLLLAGIGAAMVGATALVLKQNQVIDADFQQIGKDAASAIEQAAAPLAVDMHQSLVDLDHQVNVLAPDFKNLFAAAEPDVSAVTTGLSGFVGSLLPGVSKAISGSQVIVTDFSRSLPALGSGVGSFFTGLVRDADVQGQALEQTVGTLGNAFRTAGSVIGSASAAASADLLALTPAINGVLTAVNAISSPATVGGLVGAFGALKLDPKIQSGLLSGAEGLSKVADKAEEAGGLVGKVSGVAGGASGALAKMAGVVGGPWGIAIGAGIGLASGLAAALFHADDATKAITVDSQSLQAAVAQDGAKVGEATTAYVAAQAQLSGLADIATNAGVSLDTLVQAAIGNRDAQHDLSTSVGESNKAVRAQQMVGEQTLSGFNNLNQAMATGSDRLTSSLEVTNTLTTANQKLVNSVKAIAQQTSDAIEKQAQYDQATAELNDSTNIFNATLDADYQKLVLKSQATADNTIASLNLGVAQSSLNQALAGVVQQYGLATEGGNAYSSTLTALNGTTSNLLTSEAAFTTALAGVATAAAANGHSLDVNNVKGAANVQTFAQLAQSADKAAAAVYESEVNTKGANQAYDDANKKLAAEKQAFIDAADKAGFNKTQVKQLADELFKLPQDISIPIDADTKPAVQKLNGLIQKIDASSGVVQVYATTSNPSGGKAYIYDDGGPVNAPLGAPIAATVHGGEYVLSHGMLTGKQAVDPWVLAALHLGGSGGGGQRSLTSALPLGSVASSIAAPSAAGGYLPPAVAFHGSGVPQPVLSGAQWQQLAALSSRAGAGAAGRTTNMWVYPPAASAEQTATEVVRRLDHAGLS